MTAQDFEREADELRDAVRRLQEAAGSLDPAAVASAAVAGAAKAGPVPGKPPREQPTQSGAEAERPGGPPSFTEFMAGRPVVQQVDPQLKPHTIRTPEDYQRFLEAGGDRVIPRPQPEQPNPGQSPAPPRVDPVDVLRRAAAGTGPDAETVRPPGEKTPDPASAEERPPENAAARDLPADVARQSASGDGPDRETVTPVGERPKADRDDDRHQGAHAPRSEPVVTADRSAAEPGRDGKAGEPGKAIDAESGRVLTDIRDGVFRLVQLAAQGQGLLPVPGQPSTPSRGEERSDDESETPKPAEKGPGLGSAVSPITNAVTNNALGRAVKNAYHHVRQFFPKAKAATGSGGRGPSRQASGSGDKSNPRQPTGGEPAESRPDDRRSRQSTKKPAGGKPSRPKFTDTVRVPKSVNKVGGKGGRPVANVAGSGAGKPPAGTFSAEGAASGGRAAAGGAEAAAGAEAGVAAAAGPLAIVAAAAVAVYELGKAAHQAALSQEEFNRKLGEFSPSQAAVSAQQDYRRSVRSFERGEDTASTSERLAESIDRLEGKAQPLLTMLDNLSNRVLSEAVQQIADLVEVVVNVITILKEIFPVLKDLLDKGDDGRQGLMLGEFLKQRADAVAAWEAQQRVRRNGGK